MSKFIRNLIEYNGVEPSAQSNCLSEQGNTFKQGNIDFNFCIPEEKPDIEQIVKIWVNFEAAHYEIVKTPKGSSYEGQIITGNKLLLIGDLNFKVQYVGDNCERSVHTAHTKIPFCQYIVMPEGYSLYATISPKVYIEDIFSSQIDKRCIYNNVTLMTIVSTC